MIEGIILIALGIIFAIGYMTYAEIDARKDKKNRLRKERIKLARQYDEYKEQEYRKLEETE